MVYNYGLSASGVLDELSANAAPRSNHPPNDSNVGYNAAPPSYNPTNYRDLGSPTSNYLLESSDQSALAAPYAVMKGKEEFPSTITATGADIVDGNLRI